MGGWEDILTLVHYNFFSYKKKIVSGILTHISFKIEPLFIEEPMFSIERTFIEKFLRVQIAYSLHAA